MYEDTKVHSNM